MLAVIILMMSSGVQLPWEEAAKFVDPEAGGEALKQAAMKRRDEFTREGYVFPTQIRARKDRDVLISLSGLPASPTSSGHESIHEQSIVNNNAVVDCEAYATPMSLRKRQLGDDDEGSSSKRARVYDSDSAGELKREEDEDYEPFSDEEKDVDPDFTIVSTGSATKKGNGPVKKLSIKAGSAKMNMKAAAVTVRAPGLHLKQASLMTGNRLQPRRETNRTRRALWVAWMLSLQACVTHSLK